MRNSIIVLILAGGLIALPFTLRARSLTSVLLQDDSAAAARGLSSADPLVRQRAAEELARMVALDQARLIEGYRTQEKDKRVALALDWALYRVGRNEKLFSVIAELGGKRDEQAMGYLSQLESPDPLYPVMAQSRAKVLIGLLTVLGRIGDPRSIANVASYQSNFDPKVAEAAKAALAEIDQRSAQAPSTPGARDRVTTPTDDPQP
jgi:HEAT repeat protein